MATRLYAVNPGLPSTQVIENIGPTATSAIIGLVVDLAASVTGTDGVARGPSKNEVLQSLEILKEYIIRDNSWPPA